MELGWTFFRAWPSARPIMPAPTMRMGSFDILMLSQGEDKLGLKKKKTGLCMEGQSTRREAQCRDHTNKMNLKAKEPTAIFAN